MNASEHDTGESNTKLPPGDDDTSSTYSRVEREMLPEGSGETCSLGASAAKAVVSRRPDPKVQPAKKGRRIWKKPEGMPKRPLSAYNLFFRAERQQILGEELSREYEITDQSKRKHRKSHGKVGFAEMARLISDKWKSMSSEEKEKYENEASQEKLRYNKELLQWQKTELEAAAETDAETEDFDRKMSIDQSASEEASHAAARDIAQHDATTEFPQAGLRTTDLAVGHLATSPRSETASFLASFPVGSHAVATSSMGANSEAAARRAPSVVGLGRFQESVTLSPAPAAIPQSSLGLLASSVPATHSAVTSLRGVGSSSSTDQNLALLGNDRVRRLEELYRLHLAEAAFLREELGRQVPSSSTSAAVSDFLQPQELQINVGRRYGDFRGMMEDRSRQEELRRQVDVPPGVSGTISAFSQHPQSLPRSTRRRFSEFPPLVPQQMDVLGGSERLSGVPRMARFPQQQFDLQGRRERLLGQPYMPADVRSERYAIEQTRQDLIALERAVELRRAELAALDQRVADQRVAAAWGRQPLHRGGSSAQAIASPHQHGHLPLSQQASASEQSRRWSEEEQWLFEHQRRQPPP